MATNPSEQAIEASLELSAARRQLKARSSAGGLNLLTLLGVLTVYWCYVALSNVLYANSMQASIEQQHVFAAWPPRMLQHLFLYPFLAGAVWTSLRVSWQPAWRAAPIQLLLCVGFAVLAHPALALGEWICAPAHDEPQGMASGLANWIASAQSFVLTYGFGLALISGLLWYQRYRDAQARFSALERSLAATRLGALRMQLSPHTLFNLLHTIRGQIAWDPNSAQNMVVQLADVLRRLLAAGERAFSRLGDEFEFTRLYLDLQCSRFSDRLSFEIVNGQLPQLWVPSLILQPLVENAVVHGLAGHAGPVHVRVEAAIEDQSLRLRVINTTAPGASAGAQGIGLRNVRERLNLHFPDAARFRACAIEQDQWIAEISLPVVRDARIAESAEQ